MRRIVLSGVTALVVGTTVVAAAPGAWADEPLGTARVTIAYDGRQANNSSHFPVVSGDGRTVAFSSNADNLVVDDWNGAADVFVRDLSTGVNTLVSVGLKNAPARGASHGASLSHDGRFVAFHSPAANLVGADTNKTNDVFVRDLRDGTTTRISVATDGSQGNGPSRDAQISADGRWVAFSTTATNLAPGAVGTHSKVLLHDRETGTTTEVSVLPDGTSGADDSELPTISADGRYVAFHSYDWEIVPASRFIAVNAYVRDVQTGTTVRVNATSLSRLGYAIVKPGTAVALSADGRYVTFYTDSVMVPEDTNRAGDAYRVEVATGAVVRVSVGADGAQGNRANGFNASGAWMSADGRYVVFDSEASNLAKGDDDNARDIFVRDTVDGTTTLVSTTPVGTGGAPDTRPSYFPAISADGGAVVFTTDGALVDGDTNGFEDVYLHRLR